MITVITNKTPAKEKAFAWLRPLLYSLFSIRVYVLKDWLR